MIFECTGLFTLTIARCTLLSPVLSAIKLSRLKEYIVNKVWACSYVRSPTCNQVLSTYDVSHVINFTRLSPFLSTFSSRVGRAWE